MARFLKTIPRPESDFVKRLNSAITACRKLKNTTDENNAKMLRTYISNYNKSMVSNDPHPLNMIDRTVSVWLPFLVGGNPKIIIRPKLNPGLTPFAYVFQLAINEWMKQTKFDQRTLEPAVFNSLFSSGITKTGTARADMKELQGYLTVTGKPYCEVVDSANYVFDITAKDREQYEYEGDFYVLPTDDAKEMFAKHADSIKPDFKLFNENSAKDIMQPENVPYNELREYSEFVDLWLPHEQAIITILPPHKGYNKILKTIPYNGPDSGPYDVLSYKNIPGSTIPIPPIFTLMEMDAAINKLYAKSREGAERLKKIGVFEAGNEKDAETVQSAKYGEMIGLNNAASVKELTLGGVVPEIWDFLGFTLAQFSEQAGITGLDYRMKSKTATQDQMLLANSSRGLEFMSGKTHRFAESIGEKLMSEIWQNPTFQISAIKKFAGLDDIPVMYDYLEQEGELLDYQLEVEMYSMQRNSPQETFSKMWQLLTGWVLPTAPMAAQQGKMPNIPAITKDLTTFLDINTDNWYLSETPQRTELNPYQTVSGVKSADTRFGSNTGDNANNALTAQMSRMGKSTQAA